jgi:hypothetical protein
MLLPEIAGWIEHRANDARTHRKVAEAFTRFGGNRSGTRIPRMYRENITESEILDSLDQLVGRWAWSSESRISDSVMFSRYIRGMRVPLRLPPMCRL